MYVSCLFSGGEHATLRIEERSIVGDATKDFHIQFRCYCFRDRKIKSLHRQDYNRNSLKDN